MDLNSYAEFFLYNLGNHPKDIREIISALIIYPYSFKNENIPSLHDLFPHYNFSNCENF